MAPSRRSLCNRKMAFRSREESSPGLASAHVSLLDASGDMQHLDKGKRPIHNCRYENYLRVTPLPSKVALVRGRIIILPRKPQRTRESERIYALMRDTGDQLRQGANSLTIKLHQRQKACCRQHLIKLLLRFFSNIPGPGFAGGVSG